MHDAGRPCGTGCGSLWGCGRGQQRCGAAGAVPAAHSVIAVMLLMPRCPACRMAAFFPLAQSHAPSVSGSETTGERAATYDAGCDVRFITCRCYTRLPHDAIHGLTNASHCITGAF